MSSFVNLFLFVALIYYKTLKLNTDYIFTCLIEFLILSIYAIFAIVIYLINETSNVSIVINLDFLLYYLILFGIASSSLMILYVLIKKTIKHIVKKKLKNKTILTSKKAYHPNNKAKSKALHSK